MEPFHKAQEGNSQLVQAESKNITDFVNTCN